MSATKVGTLIWQFSAMRRCSTNGQTLASQDAELMAAGCAKVYQEKVSGARTDRAELAKVMKRLERGDLLIVTPGRKRVMARGVRFGRPRKLDAHQRQEALERLANGETLINVARTYAVDPTTIGRLLYNGA